MQTNNDGKQMKRVMIFVKYIYNYLIKNPTPLYKYIIILYITK